MRTAHIVIVIQDSPVGDHAIQLLDGYFDLSTAKTAVKQLKESEIYDIKIEDQVFEAVFFIKEVQIHG